MNTFIIENNYFHKGNDITKKVKIEIDSIFIENGNIVFSHETRQIIARIDQIPMTINGSALHNVQNALGVVGLCKSLRINNEAIETGLMNFGRNPADNPGRTNVYDVNGATVIVDFAHNPHSMKAVMSMVSNMAKTMSRQGNISVMFSHGGDRSNQDILEVANEVFSIQPNTYILSELEVYLRGRAFGEISNLVEAHLLSKGVDKDSLIKVNNPLEGAKKALEGSKSGDLVLLFVLDERDRIEKYLAKIS